MDKEAKKLKAIEIKQNIQVNAIVGSFMIGFFGSGFSILLAFALNPICIIGVPIFILIAIWEYTFIMRKGIEASKKQYKGILKFD